MKKNNKLFTKIGAAIVGIAMAIGVGVAAGSNSAREARATEDVFYTLTPANGSSNSYGGNCDVAISGITWNVEGNSQQQPWRLGGKNLSGVDRCVTSKTGMGSAITKIELAVGTAANITVNSLTLKVASNEDFSSEIDSVNVSFTASSTLTIRPTAPETSWASGSYYKFVFNLTVSGNDNKFVQFSNAKFYRDASQASSFTVTYSAPGVTAGTAPVDDTEYANGAEVTVEGPGDLEKTVYSFEGWSDGNEHIYNPLPTEAIQMLENVDGLKGTNFIKEVSNEK